MARPMRIDYPGAVHHIFFRGNRKEDIFIDGEDRVHFLDLLKEKKNRYNVKIYAYCLMNNHVHLLLESGSIHIGNFMRELLTNYVQNFNRKWDRVGHLLQGRYKSKLVDKDSYLFTLIKYINLNPVKGNLCNEPEEYPYSSHQEYIGKREPIVEVAEILSHFKNVSRYVDFIKEGEPKLPNLKRFKRYEFYGEEEFINDALKRVSMQKRERGHRREEITFSDVKSFIKRKFDKDLNKLTPYMDAEVKRYVSVILRDRLHYNLHKISKIIGVNFRTVSYLYQTSDKDMTLSEFDKNWKLED